VIVGASTAGATAAATLRQEGVEGPVVLLGAEPHPPYERPPLSTGYLQGKTSLEQLWLRPAGFWQEHGIDLRPGVAATRVDALGQAVELADGTREPYERLLIATGGRNRRPPIPGFELEGVCDLRHVADADAIRRRAEPGARAVVVGLGFIGCEVAASLRARGLEVTAVEPQPTPLAQVLGEDVGAVVAGLHRERGVQLALGDAVDHFDGDGAIEAVVTRQGHRLACDLAVVGLGLEPATEIIADTDVAVDDGIVVDEHARSSVPGIYAAGDVARHWHPLLGRFVRVEHWQHALKHGAAAARAMAGTGEPFTDVPWFWSDQYDTTIQYAGAPAEWDQLVLRGDVAARQFSGFYLGQGRLQGVVAVNRPRDVRAGMRLIAAGGAVDPRQLADEDVDLGRLARRGGPVG
jgi:3-phenylpropionate/trans-cinnamate dioxygenase ferredoxin reductase subunit